MRVVIDTGIFSASLSRRRRACYDEQLQLLAGSQVFLAVATVAELRYGALVAGWGFSRRSHLEASIEATTVVPVTNNLLSRIADLRFTCRQAGHPLVDRAHTSDLWIAASAIHVDAALLTADDIFSDAPGLTLLR